MNNPKRPDGSMETRFQAGSEDSAQTAGETVVSTPANSTTRRALLKVGAGLAASISGVSCGFAAPAITGCGINMPKALNIIVLMTDQERHHMHWPQGWAEKNLPGLQRLKRHGSILIARMRPPASARLRVL